MTDQPRNLLHDFADALREHDAQLRAAIEAKSKTFHQLERIDKILAGGQIDQANGERERKLLNLVAYYHRHHGDPDISARYETAATRQALKERDEALARVANEPIMLDEYRRQLDAIKEAYVTAVGAQAHRDMSARAIAEYIIAAAGVADPLRDLWAASEQRITALEAKLAAAEKRATAAEHDLEALDELVHAARKSFPTTAPPEDLLTLGPKLRAMGPALRQLREQHGIRLSDFARATDAHVPALATIELGLEPLWDAMLSADEAEKRLGTVPPESDLHAALRNVKLREEVAHLKNERRKDKDALDDLRRRADGLANQLELSHTAHASLQAAAASEAAAVAERLDICTREREGYRREAGLQAERASEAERQYHALEVNPCTTCVRERDTARTERDEAMRRAEAAGRGHVAAEKTIAELRGRIVSLEVDIKHIVSAYHDVGGANPASAAAVAAYIRQRPEIEQTIRQGSSLHVQRADMRADTLNTAVAERDKARAEAEERRRELLTAPARLTLQIVNEAMPPGYKLVSETDEEGDITHRWQTPDRNGARWSDPVAALAEAWSPLRDDESIRLAGIDEVWAELGPTPKKKFTGFALRRHLGAP